MMTSALRDMRGEGFPPDKVSFSLEIEAAAAAGRQPRISRSLLKTKTDAGTFSILRREE